MKKRYFLFGLFLFFIMTINVNAANDSNDDFVKSYYDEYYDFNPFIKKDSDGNSINNAEFKQYDLNNKLDVYLPRGLNNFEESADKDNPKKVFVPKEYAYNDTAHQSNGNDSSIGGKTNSEDYYSYLSGYDVLLGLSLNNNEFVSENEKNVSYNGKNHKITIKNYTSNLEYQNAMHYYIDFNILFDGKVVGESILIYHSTLEDGETFVPSNYTFTLKDSNIKYVKGLDNKNYLIIVLDNDVVNYYPNENIIGNSILIFDDTDLIGLYHAGVPDNIVSLTGDDANTFKVNNKYKFYNIGTNKIKALYYDNMEESTTFSLNEYEITINNSEFNVKKLNNQTMELSSSAKVSFSGLVETKLGFDVKSLLTDKQKNTINNLKTYDNYLALKDKMVEQLDTCGGKDSFISKLRNANGFSIPFAPIISGQTATVNPPGDAVLIQPYPGSYETLGKGFVPRIFVSDSASPGISLEPLNPGTIEDNHLTVGILSFMKVEESKTPKGLEKLSFVVPIQIVFTYFKDSNNNLSLESEGFYSLGYLLKYDPTIDYSNVVEAYSKIDNSHVIGYDEECAPKPFSYMCIEDEEVTVEGNSSGNSCPAIQTLIDKKSTEDLSKKVAIETYVNGKQKVSVKKNTDVEITVKVQNDANTPAYDNVIVSNVPDNIIVDEDSIVKGGVYNKDKNTITWNLDYLDAQGSEVYKYNAKVPSDASVKDIYQITASITNSDFTEPVNSQIAEVNLGEKLVNPETGSLTYQIIVVLLTISVLSMLYVVKKNNIQNI